MVAYEKMVETLVVDGVQRPHSEVSEAAEQVQTEGDQARWCG